MNSDAETKLISSFILLGSNLGDRLKYLHEAIRLLNDSGSRVVAGSSVYETEPWGFISDDYFLNMVIELRTSLSPEGLLGKIKTIETNLGRSAASEKYASRTIDLDILFWDDLIIDKPGLIIPHPLISVRRFVLEPMNEIAPGFNHPVAHKTIAHLLKKCTDKSMVKKKLSRFTPGQL